MNMVVNEIDTVSGLFLLLTVFCNLAVTLRICSGNEIKNFDRLFVPTLIVINLLVGLELGHFHTYDKKEVTVDMYEIKQEVDEESNFMRQFYIDKEGEKKQLIDVFCHKPESYLLRVITIKKLTCNWFRHEQPITYEYKLVSSSSNVI